MVRNNKVPWGPRDYITYGLLGAVAGGLVAGVVGAGGNGSDATLLFALVATVAGIVVTIGIIGQGVAIGMRQHRNERLLEKVQDDA